MTDRAAHDLAQVLADVRGEAALLRRAGHAEQAEYVEALCTRVATAAEDYLKTIRLADARLKSGLSEKTLKRRFRELHDCGLAGLTDHGEMWFRACAIPQRASVAASRERGKRAVA